MKKVILIIALVASLIAMSNVQEMNAMSEQPTTAIIWGDDGYVDIKFEDLTLAVQASVTSFKLEYDVKALKYNAEKKLTKVVLIKKDDQTAKTVYLDDEGKRVKKVAKMEKAEEAKAEKVKKEEIKMPSA